MFDPFVLDVGDELYLYYSDRASGTVMVSRSGDGVNWDDRVVALQHADSSDDWDSVVNRASVVRHGGAFYMWFTGQGSGGSSIGVARSDDGLSFRKVVDAPVLSYEDFPGCEAVMNPCVVWDGRLGAFRMWFAAGEEYEPDVLYAAESDDGVSWALCDEAPVLRKGANEYDQAKVGGCDVVALDGGFVMFYIGYQNVDVARICAAWSPDGDRWERFDGNPLISPMRGNWDSDAVYKPAALLDRNTGNIRVWYNGRNGSSEKIGLALISASVGVLNPERYGSGR